MLSRRSIITGLMSLVAAPTIVRASSLMPVRYQISWERVITVVGFDQFGKRRFEEIVWPIGEIRPSVYGERPWSRIESISVSPLAQVSRRIVA
jgi:hypothetical protein